VADDDTEHSIQEGNSLSCCISPCRGREARSVSGVSLEAVDKETVRRDLGANAPSKSKKHKEIKEQKSTNGAKAPEIASIGPAEAVRASEKAAKRERALFSILAPDWRNARERARPSPHSSAMDRMVAYVAINCDTPVDCEAIDRGAGAGETECFECGGTGDWGQFYPEPPGHKVDCRDCKGSGRVFVSV
jgi:hypothetical protein